VDSSQGLVRELILWLWDKNESAERRLSGPTKEIHRLIASRWAKVENDKRLEQLLRGDGQSVVDLQKVHRFIYLEPLQDESIVPVLSLWYSARNPRPQLRLRVALFVLDESKQLAAVGVRFESPEGRGDHDYYHAQLFVEFEKGGGGLPQCPHWLPKKQPAFALNARDPITLLIAMLITLYGLDRTGRSLRAAKFWSVLLPHLKKMGLALPASR
jgi:hypothetical protein